MRKCILIFDDDPEILAVCKIILEQQNYQVATRIICDNIIKDIGEVQPDIVFMDLWIPTIGGESSIMIMKGNNSTREIPIILFSANGEIEIIASQTGANGFLKKPFELTSLLDMVKDNIRVLT